MKIKLNLMGRGLATIAIAAIAFFVVAIIAFVTINRFKVNGPVYQHIVQGKDLVADILPPPEYIIETYLVSLQMLGTENQQELDALITRSQNLKNDFMERHQYWEKDLEEGAMKTTLMEDAYQPAQHYYQILEQKFIPLVREGKLDDARQLAYFGELRKAYEEHRAAIDKVVEDANARIAVDEKNATTALARGILLMAIITAFGVLGFGAFIFFIKNVITAINKNVDIMEAMAAGDLMHRLNETREDELGAMSHAMDAFAESISGMVGLVKGSAEHLATVTKEIAASSQQIADGAQQQSASFEELVSSVQTNSENINNANHIAHEVSQNAQMAGQAMDNTVTAISDIERGSKQMDEAVELITDIADQTNLLALNAAIEAARAGEHGKGFAVVADEVRQLAERSATTAKEIQGLIKKNLTQVEGSVNVSKDAGEKTKKIVDDIKRIAEQLSSISTATQEQSSAMEENTSITESNASASEELASSSQSMDSQAERLKGLVSLFKADSRATELAMNITNAIVAHGKWKVRLKDAANSGRSEFSVDKVRVDDGCDFGKWFYSLPPEQIASAEAVKIKEMHADFHKEAARILELALNGHLNAAKKAIKPGSYYGKISSSLVSILADWKKHA